MANNSGGWVWTGDAPPPPPSSGTNNQASIVYGAGAQTRRKVYDGPYNKAFKKSNNFGGGAMNDGRVRELAAEVATSTLHGLLNNREWLLNNTPILLKQTDQEKKLALMEKEAKERDEELQRLREMCKTFQADSTKSNDSIPRP